MAQISADEVRSLVRRLMAETVEESRAASLASLPSGAGVTAMAASAELAAPKTIAVGADHGGFRLKARLLEHLQQKGFAVADCGTSGEEPVDYPDFAYAVAMRVATGESAVGIVVDGAGIGSCIVANKVPGVRAALCYDLSTAANAREHNHANVLTLGAGMIGEALAKHIVDRFLETPFGPDRHARRVAMITEIESRRWATPAGLVAR